MGADSIFSDVRGVIFDMDGTLVDSPLDFNAIRAEARVPAGVPILEFMAQASGADRQRVERVLSEHEERAALTCVPRDGAFEVNRELRRRGLKTALLTRNSARSVRTVLKRFDLHFDTWVSRDEAEPKPSPAPLFYIADRLGLAAQQLMIVGDYVFDVECGRRAGARTAFVKHARGVEPPPGTDVVIERLSELLDLLPDRSG